MENLNVFDIRKMLPMYNWCNDPFACSYYHDICSTQTLKIYIERNILFEAQWLYLFELVRNENFFLLKIFTQNDVDADVAGSGKEEVVSYVITRIIKKTTLGSQWQEENPELKEKHLAEKEALKKILEKIVGEFVG